MRLIVVSNRLPVTLKVDGGVSVRESVGGLATAMKSFLAATNRGEDLGLSEVLWVGWSGMPSESETEEVRAKLRELGLYTVPLSSADVNLYYEGFCNATLWPLFHSFQELAVYREEHWRAYVEANRKFARAVEEVAQPGDIVWIHDYHLMLAPKYLRNKELGVGFFLHIPFPPPEILQLMPPPWRSEILEGLLSADLVGFHTYDYVNNFVRSAVKFLGYKAEADHVVLNARRVRVGVFPIGIDFNFFHKSGERGDVRAEAERLRALLSSAKIIFSIDRLDYTKGILNRVKAFEEFLKAHPEWRRRVAFILVVVPSRTGVPQYEAMKREIDREVGRINGEFSEVDWVPIVYIYRFIPTPALLAMYNVADAALITPIRDGMNLVSKEYVASRADCRGVLILSEMAGAARELTEALVVNPNDVHGTAEAIARALTMAEEEQCRRIKAMQERLREYDVVRWGVEYITALIESFRARRELEEALKSAPLDPEAVAEAVGKAQRALLLLDYDGTLVPLRPYSYQAIPDGALLELLKALAAKFEVAVVSGRPRDFLETWFGGLPIHLIAEHGAWIRLRGSEWINPIPFDASWRPRVRRILEEGVRKAPGSYVEEKDSSVAWHYRNVEEEVAEKVVKELLDELTALSAGEFNIYRGKKVIEVRPTGVNKGVAAKLLVDRIKPDVVLAVGDDETDEDMFKALPADALTVRVGLAETYARYFATSYKDVRKLLALLAGKPA